MFEYMFGAIGLLLVLCVLGSAVYQTTTGNTGTLTLSFPASGAIASVTPVLSALSISQSGGSVGPNSRVDVWDGPIGTGTKIWSAFLSSPGAPIMSAPGVVTGGLGGSVGIVQELPLPFTPDGKSRCLQATPGNQMNVQVIGTALNNVILNCRFSDGLPT